MILYTDGSGHLQGPIGFAWRVLDNEGSIVSEGADGAVSGTSNIAELRGAIHGLHDCRLRVLPGTEHISVRCDSAYVVSAFRDDWIGNWQRNNWKTSRKRKVKNKELWEKLWALVSEFQMLGISIEFQHIPAHSGIEHNEWCDQAAGQARRAEMEKLG